MNILGISAYYHDSAACLLQDGRVTAAAHEERFSRKKNDPGFPIAAVNYCLQAGGIVAGDLDYVAFYEKPYLKFSRVLSGHIDSWPGSFRTFLSSMPLWLKDRLALPIVLEETMGYGGRTLFVRHHLSHSASSFLVSPFEEAAILTADAVGEWATASCGRGLGAALSLDREMRFPNSIGLLYTTLTTFLGFDANGGEGTVMALAGCGRPIFMREFSKIAVSGEDGCFRLNPAMFDFYGGGPMYTRALSILLGGPRPPGGPITERHGDIAASLQKFTEDTLVAMARGLRVRTASDNLCLAGGVFLNCVANQKILERSGFKNIFIQPSAGDAGGALGAACYVYNCVLNRPRSFVMKNAFLGPGYDDRQIEKAIAAEPGAAAGWLDDGSLYRKTAELLASGKVVGWFQERAEFGPRALGNRSILGDPRNPRMKEILNARVKFRESFRPYAPAVLEERAAEYFESPAFSPFMLLAPRVRQAGRDKIPAACHEDGTARAQAVSSSASPRFYALIKEFEAQTGVPILINTSFNRKGEPVVCTPGEALRVYTGTEMDALVLGNYFLEKVPPAAGGGGLDGV